jgi:hypothetical protein
MERKTLLLILFSTLLAVSAAGQVTFQALVGVGYLEHFSVGVGCGIGRRHHATLLYGSDLFIQPKNFSTFMAQYSLSLHRLEFLGVLPAIGVKGGGVIYSDEYYRWNLAVVIPFIELQCSVRRNTSLFLQGGAQLSFEQTVERLSYGEIGHYKELLPEIKAGVVYNFCTVK